MINKINMSWFNKSEKDEENQMNNVDNVREISKNKKLLSTWVFDRKWEDKISEQKFFGTIWIVLAWWLWLTALLAYYANQIWYQPTIIGLIIWFAICILWMFIAINRIIICLWQSSCTIHIISYV